MLGLRHMGALLATAVAAAACTTGARGGAQDDGRIREVEERVGDFDPRYVQGSEGRHLAVFFRSAGDSLVLDTATPQLRPGSLRYFPPANTGFRVAYRDRDGRELGSYFVEDPRTVRVCDEGGDRGSVREPNARFEVLLPANPAIAVLELGDPRRPIRVQVDTILRRAVQSQPGRVPPR